MNKFLPILAMVLGSSGCFAQLPAQLPKETNIAYYNRCTKGLDAVWHESGGDIDKSLQYVKAMYNRWPDEIDVMSNYGLLLSREGKTDQELTVYRDFRTKHPKMPAAAFYEGHYYFERGQYKNTIAVLQPSVKTKQCYYELGWSYARVRNNTSALKTWEACLKLYPKDKVAQRNVNKLKHA